MFNIRSEFSEFLIWENTNKVPNTQLTNITGRMVFKLISILLPQS